MFGAFQNRMFGKDNKCQCEEDETIKHVLMESPVWAIQRDGLPNGWLVEQIHELVHLPGFKTYAINIVKSLFDSRSANWTDWMLCGVFSFLLKRVCKYFSLCNCACIWGVWWKGWVERTLLPPSVDLCYLAVRDASCGLIRRSGWLRHRPELELHIMSFTAYGLFIANILHYIFVRISDILIAERNFVKIS